MSGTLADSALQSQQAASEAAALGMAAKMLHNVRPFSGLSAPRFVGTLLGQIARKHYVFTTRGKEVLGYAGWALTSEEVGRAWAQGRRIPDYQESLDGPCVTVLTFYAGTPEAVRFQARFLRGLRPDAPLIGRRQYSDERIRPLILRGRPSTAS